MIGRTNANGNTPNHQIFYASPTSVTNVKFPECGNIYAIIAINTTSLDNYATSNEDNLRYAYLPKVTSIGSNAFKGCTKLKKIYMPNITTIRNNAFDGCPLEGTLVFENDINIGNYGLAGNHLDSIVFKGTATLGTSALSKRFAVSQTKSVEFKKSVNSITTTIFENNSTLESVILPNGWNTNNLAVHYSTNFTHDMILEWFNKLADRTGDTTYTFTIGATNLNKMSANEIAIATAKNWTIA